MDSEAYISDWITMVRYNQPTRTERVLHTRKTRVGFGHLGLDLLAGLARPVDGGVRGDFC